ncbi:MAG TPA: hypothetical protein VML55_24620 [Planctomycetaceae bacterium]|nr:hypothetical protein [Planctomycetaceae bacterium]
MLLPALLSATAVCWLAGDGASGETGPDLLAGAAPVLHVSFESEREDRDYDGHPDDWTRRKGPGFPAYVNVSIDREQGSDGRQSLRFDVDGGQAALYSPPVPIDPLHAYVFRGAIRTEGLEHDAAVVSVSFLNHRRQRVGRSVTRPVSGTHAEWVSVRLGPLLPGADVRFLVLGCHVVHGRKQDIRGRVWFDDLRMGRLPRMSLVSNVRTHFVRRSLPVRIEAHVSGLEQAGPAGPAVATVNASGAAAAAQLRLTLYDSAGRRIAEESFPLPASNVGSTRAADTPDGPDVIVWTLPPQEYGFYRVGAALERNGATILNEEMTFAVTDLVEAGPSGEFGWSVEGGARGMPLSELADVAAQAGINWLKFPVWQSVTAKDARHPADVSEMFDQLRLRNVTPIGLLADPPPEVRRKFAKDWSGVSEVFALPPSFWSGSLDPVIARYSSLVHYWQLGGDSDSSFVGMTALAETLVRVKREFDRIGRNTHVGLRWELDAPLPAGGPSGAFVSLNDDRTLPDDELHRKVRALAGPAAARWLVLKPLPRSKHSPEDRGADLVRRMVSARISGSDGIFAWDVFDPEHGLLNPDGSPTLLFLPWRTTALALRQTEFIGSLDLPGGSRNFAFARDGEVVLVLWNPKPTVEELFLGEPGDVSTIDIWGVRRQAPVRTVDRHFVQSIEVGPTPLVVRGCSEPVARWRLAVRFDKARIPSATGGHPEGILGRNTFREGVSGEVSLNVPREWESEPRSWKFGLAPGEEFRLPLVLSLPSGATLGAERTSIDFVLDADRQYQFRVYRPYQVGLGDIEIDVLDRRLPDGTLEIEQIITNNTDPEEVLNLECSLFVPGQKRQIKSVTKLGRGISRKLYYVPAADTLHGRELWIRAEQLDGRRVLNKRWTVGQTWAP